MENLKYSVWVLWFGSAAAAMWGSGWVSIVGHLAFWSTLLGHVAEFLVKRSLFERAGGSLASHFVQTLIYGLFHWKPIQDRTSQNG